MGKQIPPGAGGIAIRTQQVPPTQRPFQRTIFHSTADVVNNIALRIFSTFDGIYGASGKSSSLPEESPLDPRCKLGPVSAELLGKSLELKMRVGFLYGVLPRELQMSDTIVLLGHLLEKDDQGTVYKKIYTILDRESEEEIVKLFSDALGKWRQYVLKGSTE